MQEFRSVFRTGLHDPALLNAVLLTASFAVADGAFESDSLHYQTEAIKALQQQIRDSDAARTISTLGTILLLAGIEVRNHVSSLVVALTFWETDPAGDEASGRTAPEGGHDTT